MSKRSQSSHSYERHGRKDQGATSTGRTTPRTLIQTTSIRRNTDTASPSILGIRILASMETTLRKSHRTICRIP
jgi:hypothetical protein